MSRGAINLDLNVKRDPSNLRMRRTAKFKDASVEEESSHMLNLIEETNSVSGYNQSTDSMPLTKNLPHARALRSANMHKSTVNVS